MAAEPEQDVQDPDEGGDDLCLCCAAANVPEAPFCQACGAPLTSYAATGPVEHILAEGFAYRQAVEQPRSVVVVIGIWLIFGVLGSQGALLALMGWERKSVALVFGGALFVASLVVIVRTTKNYRAQRQARPGPGDDDAPA